MNEEIKVMKDDRGVEYKCLTYTSRFTGETDVAFDIQQYMNERSNPPAMLGRIV